METKTVDPDEQPLANTVAIADCGSYKLRVGFAGDEAPLMTIPTVVGKVTLQNVSKKLYGFSALSRSTTYKISHPVQRGFIRDWDDTEELLEYIIQEQLHMNPKKHQLLLTEPPNNPRANRIKSAEMVLEKFQFKSFILMPSTPMGMYGCGSITGVMVESGAGQTHIVAFSDGDYIPNSYRHLPFGGNDLSNYLGELLTENGKAVYFRGKPDEFEILNNIKHFGCHVVLNYDQQKERVDSDPNLVARNIVLRDNLVVALSSEAFQVPEVLFKPELIGIQTGGIPQNIYECIESCSPSLKEKLYGNICLCGGNTMFSGIEDRLLWEVKTYAGPNIKVKINAQPNRENLVFLGTSVVGVCPMLNDILISYQDYLENGPQIVDWKYF